MQYIKQEKEGDKGEYFEYDVKEEHLEYEVKEEYFEYEVKKEDWKMKQLPYSIQLQSSLTWTFRLFKSHLPNLIHFNSTQIH